MDTRLKGLFEEVIKEAYLLRKHATEEEKNKLDLGVLDGDNAKTCIYGLLTGHCDSSRAVELLELCAKHYTVGFTYVREPYRKTFQRDKGFYCDSTFSERAVFSAIEFYLSYAADGGYKVGLFIRGDKEELTEKDLIIKDDYVEENLFEESYEDACQ